MCKIYLTFNTAGWLLLTLIIILAIIMVSIFFNIKRREFFSLMFVFSIICFTIGGISLTSNNEYLSIFAFFMAYIFLGLIFVYTSIIEDEQGLGSYFSLTHKLQTLEKKLKATEDKLQSILENVPNIIMLINRDGTIQYTNRALPGFDLKNFVGTKVTNYIKPEFRALESAAIVQAFKRRKVCNYVVKGIGTNGCEVWYEIKVGPIKQGGQIESVVMIATDISDLKKIENELEEKIKTLEKKELVAEKILKDLTEALDQHKRTEKALRESEEKYRDLFENANDLIQSVDKNGKFKYVNQKWLTLLGYTKEEVQKMTLMDIIHKDQISHCEELFKRVCAGEVFENVETIFIAKDGREIVVEGAVNAKFEERKFVASRAIFHDITDRKLAEKELQQTVRELERFNRLAVGREHRMLELKQEINDLLYAIGQDTKYNLPAPGDIMNKIGG